MSSSRALSSPEIQVVCLPRVPQRVGAQRKAYAVPSHHITDAARSAGASARGLWPRRTRIAAHVPDPSLPRLSGWGWAHCCDCRARGTDHLGYRDARVGLWRAAVPGARAAAAPLVAALVASQAIRGLA